MVGGHENRHELKAYGANIIATVAQSMLFLLANYKGVWGHAPRKILKIRCSENEF